MVGSSRGQITDEEAEQHILSTVLIPTGFQFGGFGIYENSGRIKAITWRDIDDNLDNKILVIIRSENPRYDSSFEWKVIECTAIPARAN